MRFRPEGPVHIAQRRPGNRQPRRRHRGIHPPLNGSFTNSSDLEPTVGCTWPDARERAHSGYLLERKDRGHAQSLAQIYVHTIFSTKGREPVLASDWLDEHFANLGGTANNLSCPSGIVGGVADHVYCLYSLSRTLSVAEAIGKIKATSSVWVNQTRTLPSTFHWQDGYAAFSVSQSQVENVTRHIHDQADHHRSRSFQKERREWLQRYGISWDERYVWD